jgi:hypothetical protein
MHLQNRTYKASSPHKKYKGLMMANQNRRNIEPFQEFYLLTFRKNMLPPSSGSKNKPSTMVVLATCFHAGFLFGLFFDPEDGGNMFLQSVG